MLRANKINTSTVDFNYLNRVIIIMFNRSFKLRNNTTFFYNNNNNFNVKWLYT